MRSIFFPPAAPILLLLFASSTYGQAAFPVAVIGAKDNEIVRQVKSASIALPVYLTSEKDLPQVTVEVMPFFGPDGKTSAVGFDQDLKVNSKQLKITAKQKASFVVYAKLDALGEFTSLALLTVDKQSSSVTLKITRAASTLSATIEGGGSSSEPGLSFSVLGNDAAPIRLRPPVLLSLSRKLGDTQSSVLQPDAKFLDASKTEIKDTIPLAVGQAVPLRMTLGISTAGEYAGKLRLSSDDGSVDHSFTIKLKQPWWCAAFFIAIGVGLAWFARKFLKTDRPRLLLMLQVRRFLDLVGRTDASLKDNDERQLLAAIKDDVADISEQLSLGVLPVDANVLQPPTAKLSLFQECVNLRRQLDAVKPASIVSSLRPPLEQAEAVIRRQGATKADCDAEIPKLAAARAKIDDLVRDHLKATIKKSVEEAKAIQPTLEAVRQAEFQRDVIAVFEEADAAAQQQPPNRQEAESKMEQARKSHGRIVANDLMEKLQNTRPANGVNQQEFDSWKARCTNAADEAKAAANGKSAIEAVKRADSAYMGILLLNAEAQALDLVTKLQANPAQPRAQAAVKAVQTAQLDLKNGDVAAAKQKYKEVAKEIEEVSKLVPAPPQMMGGPAPAPAVVILSRAMGALTFEDAGSMQETEEMTLGRLENAGARSIADRIQRGDDLISLIVLVAAVVLGLSLLWTDSPVWGSPKDMIAAFLWGLGMHEAAKNVFGGKLSLDELQTALSGKAAANAQS